jgi:hypothetical protein
VTAPATLRLLDLDGDSARALDAWRAAAGDGDRGAVTAIASALRDRIGMCTAARPAAPADPAAWVAACADAVPEVAGWMRARGVAESVIAASLADIGRHVRLHRRQTGAFGVDVPWWAAEVLSGCLYQLGRLQFGLAGPGRVPPPVPTGPWVLQVHIPESGPLVPAAVARSFVLAAEFFPRNFPDRPVSIATCSSWLLDPYLAAHLPAESNIARFAGEFIPYGGLVDDEFDTLYYVFGSRTADGLGEFPRDTALQRLVLDRIAGGGRWHRARGYRRLASAESA